FLAFTAGAIVAAVGGLGYLWAPGAPALLLSAYIVYLRRQERCRLAVTMDRRRAEDAAQRLRERRPHPAARRVEPTGDETAPAARATPAPRTASAARSAAVARAAATPRTPAVARTEPEATPTPSRASLTSGKATPVPQKSAAGPSARPARSSRQ